MGVVQYLLEQGADKEKTTNNGASPLWIAAQNGHLNVDQKLLEDPYVVDVNKASTDALGRYTPLHIAVANGHIDVAICLMERGMADMNARNTDSQRPMDLALNDEMRQAIINEEKRRRDHGFKRAVISPNPMKNVEQDSKDGEVDDNDSASSDEEDEKQT